MSGHVNEREKKTAMSKVADEPGAGAKARHD